MDTYTMPIYFHLPGIFEKTILYKQFLFKIGQNPKILKDNVIIGSIYGAPGNIWNGGRLVFNKGMNEEEFINIREIVNTLNVPIRFTFTNSLIQEYHLYDEYSNLILKIFNNGKNEILCNSPILENYIRNCAYNNYNMISSTTKRLLNINDINNELEKDYKLVVLDYDFNKNFNLLQSISKPERCELLCNPVCNPNCTQRLLHYKQLSQDQLLNRSCIRRDDIHCDCSQRKFWEVQRMDNFISIDNINNIYIPLGFRNFKLEGRTHRIDDLIEILLYYLIKEEYKMEMRSYLIENFLCY